jgi:hypothetical protein
MRFRRDLAVSLQRILAAAGQPPAVVPSQAVAITGPLALLRRTRISWSASELAELAARLADPELLNRLGIDNAA